MKISVIGTGYVGLVSGTCLAEVGNDVLCLDVDCEKIRILNEDGIPIFEPGLQEMVRRNVAAGRLHFTSDTEKAVKHGSIQFIALGTPPDEDGSVDLQYVLAAARSIGRLMTDNKVVVDKSIFDGRNLHDPRFEGGLGIDWALMTGLMATKSSNTLPYLPECSAKHNLPHNLPLGPKEISCRTEGGMS
jgi:hypothetical protein